jgi:hypothetical protein
LDGIADYFNAEIRLFIVFFVLEFTSNLHTLPGYDLFSGLGCEIAIRSNFMRGLQGAPDAW